MPSLFVCSGLGMTMGEFLDMCILLGCDFASKIPGIGPKKAPKLIRDLKSIEAVLKSLDMKAPKRFDFAKVRKFFKNPPVKDAQHLNLNLAKPIESSLIKFLSEKAGMGEAGAKQNVKKLVKLFQVAFLFIGTLS